jgi:hypothetical protein
MVNGTLREVSVKVASDRSVDSWQITNGPPDQVLKGTQPPVDKLYERDTWASRTDLSIRVPGLADKNAFFNVSQPAVDGLISFLNSTLVTGSTIGARGWVEASGTAATAAKYTAPYMQMLWQYANDSSALYDSLAVSISSSVRNKVSVDSPQLLGASGTYQTFIDVRWPWFSLLCFCVGVGVIFPLLAVWDSRRNSVPLWKTSAVATLVHGLESSTLGAIKDTQMYGDIQAIADTIKVRLND